MSQSTDCPPRYRWYDYVHMSGAEGRRWVQEYRRWLPLVSQILAPLETLRRGDLEAGCEQLDAACEALAAADVAEPSLRLALERWYHGVRGYAHYACEEYDQADGEMTAAIDALAAALGARSFLLVMADDAFELTMHRARIARNLRRWDEMWAHVGAARDLREDRRAYGRLGDGSEVRASTLRAYFDGLPVPASAQPLVPHLQDPAERAWNTESSIRGILRFSGLVIPHP